MSVSNILIPRAWQELTITAFLQIFSGTSWHLLLNPINQTDDTKSETSKLFKDRTVMLSAQMR